MACYIVGVVDGTTEELLHIGKCESGNNRLVTLAVNSNKGRTIGFKVLEQCDDSLLRSRRISAYHSYFDTRFKGGKPNPRWADLNLNVEIKSFGLKGFSNL